jgi:protein tyrosine phosphatase (PTP) superfamily phosphohydrolase (DUF442 family)/chloramphenicol 3-O-phosphotransferase
MTKLQSPLFLITGAPGAGKTATTAALMRRFPFGLHIPVDDLREWVVLGIAHPVPEFTEETARQFRLARTAAAQVAALYADAGFAVAIDDVIHEPDVLACLTDALAPREVHKILLQPSLEVALARNADRTNKGFDTAVLADAIRGNHRSLGEQNRADLGWIVIDNGALDVGQTVDAILESTLRDIINFRRLSDRLITGGQPTEAELALAAAAGAEVVINLGRLDPAYALPDERGTVAALGLIYEHIPVVWAEPTAADLDAFFTALTRHAGRRLFVHCAANYRASAFNMLYRVLRLGWRIEDARPDLDAIWDPAEYPQWQAFIEAALDAGADRG